MRNIVLSVSVAAIALMGCSPNYYTPSTQNVPMITAPGQVSLSASGNANQGEIQAAVGVANNIAVQANAGIVQPKDLDNGDGGSGNFIELGVGYFKPIADHFVFETYLLGSKGSMENHFPSTKNDHPNTTGDIKANVMRYSVQPSLGYFSKNFSAAVSARLSSLNYSSIRGSLFYNNENQIGYLGRNSSMLLVEPALTIRGGLEHLKLQLQVGYSLNATNSNFAQTTTYAVVGINFMIN